MHQTDAEQSQFMKSFLVDFYLDLQLFQGYFILSFSYYSITDGRMIFRC